MIAFSIFQNLTLEAISSCIISIGTRTMPFDAIVTRLESIIVASREIVDVNNAELEQMVACIEETVIILISFEDFGNQKPRGRPRANILFSSVENLLSMNFRANKIAEMFGVSTKTISRLLARNGSSVKSSYTAITDEDLCNIARSILLEYPSTGYKRMKGFLLQRAIKVTDLRVREIMRIIDPDGVYFRTTQNRAIVRRQYYVQYSNQMWHIDTNMKLIRWKIVIRGGIDGKSRTVVYLDAGNDNLATSQMTSFLAGVRLYGLPYRCRTDKGGENVLIAQYMIHHRGPNRSSHICGRSVHNQRIERFWRDVFYGCTSFYYNVFSRLESDGILDVENEKHLLVLHFVFLPRLRRHLTGFMEGWNHHPISSESNRSPRQLMLEYLPPIQYDMEVPQEDMANNYFVCNNLDDVGQFDANVQNDITNPVILDNLNENERMLLSTIDPLRQSDYYGYDIFTEALQTLQLCT